jgi:D-arabinose 1-dehydrogenase-like Zn-dependent alcohol dehydrogenase
MKLYCMKRVKVCVSVYVQCGILVVVGIAGGSLSVSLLELVFFDLTVRGSQMGDKKLVGQLLELIAQKKVQSSIWLGLYYVCNKYVY